MEAANRGASEVGDINIGLGISLPYEQDNNSYVTRELSLFFIRKFGLHISPRRYYYFQGDLEPSMSFLKR